MNITTAQVKELRELTGAGVLECRSALREGVGDMERAVEMLREWGLASMEKRAARTADEGRIAVAVPAGNRRAAMVELRCETDFVSSNPRFGQFSNQLAQLALTRWCADVNELAATDEAREIIAQCAHLFGENIQLARIGLAEGGYVASYVHGEGRIGVLASFEVEGGVSGQERFAGYAHDVAMHIAAARPVAVTREDVPAFEVERAKGVFEAQAAASGKPAEVQEKMVAGKLDKYLAGCCLVEQAFVRRPEVSVASYTAETARALGGDISIGGFVRFEMKE